MVALMSDPPGLSRSIRRRYEALPWGPDPRRTVVRLREKAYLRKVDARLLELLRRFPSVGMFGAHHAEWALSNGVSAWYAPSPIVDLGGPDWERRRAETTRSGVPRILMIGHLRGIATISGLQVFAESILPALTRELGPDGFEVHVVGGYDPPAAAGNAFDHPAVVRRGQIEPPDDEFLAADVLLVPTPLTTGPRSRIITGMTFGSCVVAHEANRLGIPELRHGENALLAADGPGLADGDARRARRSGDPRAGRARSDAGSTSRRSRRRSPAHGSSASWSASPPKQAKPPSPSPERAPGQLDPLRRPHAGGEPIPGLPRPRLPAQSRAREPAARRPADPAPRRPVAAGDSRPHRAARRRRDRRLPEDLGPDRGGVARRLLEGDDRALRGGGLHAGEPPAASVRRRHLLLEGGRAVARVEGDEGVVRARPRGGVARASAHLQEGPIRICWIAHRKNLETLEPLRALLTGPSSPSTSS